MLQVFPFGFPRRKTPEQQEPRRHATLEDIRRGDGLLIPPSEEAHPDSVFMEIFRNNPFGRWGLSGRGTQRLNRIQETHRLRQLRDEMSRFPEAGPVVRDATAVRALFPPPPGRPSSVLETERTGTKGIPQEILSRTRDQGIVQGLVGPGPSQYPTEAAASLDLFLQRLQQEGGPIGGGLRAATFLANNIAPGDLMPIPGAVGASRAARVATRAPNVRRVPRVPNARRVPEDPLHYLVELDNIAPRKLDAKGMADLQRQGWTLEDLKHIYGPDEVENLLRGGVATRTFEADDIILRDIRDAFNRGSTPEGGSLMHPRGPRGTPETRPPTEPLGPPDSELIFPGGIRVEQRGDAFEIVSSATGEIIDLGKLPQRFQKRIKDIMSGNPQGMDLLDQTLGAQPSELERSLTQFFETRLAGDLERARTGPLPRDLEEAIKPLFGDPRKFPTGAPGPSFTEGERHFLEQLAKDVGAGRLSAAETAQTIQDFRLRPQALDRFMQAFQRANRKGTSPDTGLQVSPEAFAEMLIHELRRL